MKRKLSEKRRHVVAWLNKAEWDQVLEYLFSKDPALQRFALHRLSAWKGRYSNRTPVAVDCTADLVRCQVLDRSGQLSGDDLLLLYGSALVRFVNLITEKQQGKVAKSLRWLAGKLDIPEWVVDLRHDFTHRKLPSLKWSRKGCKVVLEWLQQKYWSRQLGGAATGDWEVESNEEDEAMELKLQEDELVAQQKEMAAYKTARELLISFEKEQYGSLQEQEKDGAWPAPFAEISWILGEIKQFALESSELLVDVLLEDGFLIPTMEQLETLACDAESNRLTEPRLQKPFLRFWLPLLKALHSSDFIHLLLEKLFSELKLLSKEPNLHRVFYISAWISEVFLCNGKPPKFHFEPKSQKNARAVERIFVNRLQLRWQQLLSACLDAPCACTPHLLQLVLDDMEHPLPLETRRKLLQLCHIYTQAGPSDETPPSPQIKQPIYTLESLHEKMQLSRSSQVDPGRIKSVPESQFTGHLAEKAKLLRGSPWQVCGDKVQWKQYPLGKVPGQSDDPSCLMVENYSTMTVIDQPVELEGAGTHVSRESSVLSRTTDGPIWNHSDVSKLKSGLQLF